MLLTKSPPFASCITALARPGFAKQVELYLARRLGTHQDGCGIDIANGDAGQTANQIRSNRFAK